MKDSLLPVATGQSLSMLVKDNNQSEIFNKSTIPTIYEFLKYGIQAGDSVVLETKEDLLLETLFMYSVDEAASKSVNLIFNERDNPFFSSSLMITQSTVFQNTFSWDFPSNMMLHKERQLTLIPDHLVGLLIITARDCNHIEKKLEIQN